MYIVSLIPALLLAGAIFNAMSAPHSHTQNGFALLVSIAICATHVIALIIYPARKTRPMALVVALMAFLSLFCFFLLLVSGQPDYQVGPMIDSTPTPAGR